MAAQIIREWSGIQQFPLATQTKLLELLGKLNQENVSTLTILVMGKGGVGKSSTVNSIVGERVVAVSAFQSEGPRPVMVSRTRAGFTLNIIDTPGLVEGGYVNDQALEIIKRFLLNKTIDVLLFVDRLDAYRMDNLDAQIVKAITDNFGREIWQRGLVVLTHAQMLPPDGLSYEEFLSRRSEALLKVVRDGARMKLQDKQGSSIPIVLVENGGRCNKNDDDEKAEQLQRALADKWQGHYRTLQCAAEERAAKRLKEREGEMEKTVRRNAELEQMAERYSTEAEVWRTEAKRLENTVKTLRASLLKATMRGGLGCGGSAGVAAAAEDAESSHVDPDRVEPVSLACKGCGKRVATVMMWPCRHVCVCKGCDVVSKTCLVCRSIKTTSIEVVLS